MKEVFISHTTADKAAANAVVDYLEKHGIDCFIAPRDVTVGSNYAKLLVQALEESLLVLLIASSKTNDSEHVLNEVDIIVEKKIPILPVFIEDYELNDEMRYYIGRRQRIMAVNDELSAYLPTILSAVEERLPKKEKPVPQAAPVEEAGQQHTKTVFEYVPDRGIMINPEDHQRNVSFRTDTLINMMGGIYEKVVSLAGGDAAAAAEIFFSSGYSSGKNFAERINSHWDTGHTIPDIRRKLNKWCEFDSAVGWGKFSVTIDYNEDTDTLSGTLRINEAFLVDKVGKRHVCAFIRGYCTGVLETLLDSTEVVLTCTSCPLKSHFKNICEFAITTKED